MKRLLLLMAVLCVAGCARKVPDSGGGWEPLSWRYSANGKVCGEMVKQPMHGYWVGILDDRGQVIFSQKLDFDSDEQAKAFFESVCQKR